MTYRSAERILHFDILIRGVHHGFGPISTHEIATIFVQKLKLLYRSTTLVWDSLS